MTSLRNKTRLLARVFEDPKNNVFFNINIIIIYKIIYVWRLGPRESKMNKVLKKISLEAKIVSRTFSFFF